jgi:hypothetical protein
MARGKFGLESEPVGECAGEFGLPDEPFMLLFRVEEAVVAFELRRSLGIHFRIEPVRLVIVMGLGSCFGCASISADRPPFVSKEGGVEVDSLVNGMKG